MQRQVFPKGRPADTAGFSDEPAATQSSVATLNQRLDALERQMSDLLRASEEHGHRLQTLNPTWQKPAPTRSSAFDPRAAHERGRHGSRRVSANGEPAAEPKPAASKPATKFKGSTAAKPEGGPAPAVSTADATPAGDPGEDAYTQGFHLWEAGQYDQAIAALKSFTAAYPKHRRASYANNLIGRSLLSKGQPAKPRPLSCPIIATTPRASERLTACSTSARR